MVDSGDDTKDPIVGELHTCDGCYKWKTEHLGTIAFRTICNEMQEDSTLALDVTNASQGNARSASSGSESQSFHITESSGIDFRVVETMVLVKYTKLVEKTKQTPKHSKLPNPNQRSRR